MGSKKDNKNKKDKLVKAEEKKIVKFILNPEAVECDIDIVTEFTAIIGKTTTIIWIVGNEFNKTTYKTRLVKELFENGTWIKI